MIERLQRALEHVEELPPEMQEQIAIWFADHRAARRTTQSEPDVREKRCESKPTPPMDEQLAWMDVE